MDGYLQGLVSAWEGIDVTEVRNRKPDLDDALCSLHIDQRFSYRFQQNPFVHGLISTFGLNTMMPLKPNVVFGAKQLVRSLDFTQFLVLDAMSKQYGNYASTLIRGDLESVKYDPDVPAIVANAILLQKLWTAMHSDLQATFSDFSGSIVFTGQYYNSLIEKLTAKNHEFKQLSRFLIPQAFPATTPTTEQIFVQGPWNKKPSSESDSSTSIQLGCQPQQVMMSPIVEGQLQVQDYDTRNTDPNVKDVPPFNKGEEATSEDLAIVHTLIPPEEHQATDVSDVSQGNSVEIPDFELPDYLEELDEETLHSILFSPQESDGSDSSALFDFDDCDSFMRGEKMNLIDPLPPVCNFDLTDFDVMLQ